MLAQHRVASGMAQTQPLPLLAALAGRIARCSLYSNNVYLPRCGTTLILCLPSTSYQQSACLISRGECGSSLALASEHCSLELLYLHKHRITSANTRRRHATSAARGWAGRCSARRAAGALSGRDAVPKTSPVGLSPCRAACLALFMAGSQGAARHPLKLPVNGAVLAIKRTNAYATGLLCCSFAWQRGSSACLACS